MEVGDRHPSKNWIVEAIQKAEAGTTGEIHVHLTRRGWDPNPMKRARQLFRFYGLDRTRERNAVLLYVNLRRRRFAIVGDEGIHAKVGQSYWDETMRELRTDLQSTFPERAVSFAVARIGKTLQKYFPAIAGRPNPNELPDQWTSD